MVLRSVSIWWRRCGRDIPYRASGSRQNLKLRHYAIRIFEKKTLRQEGLVGTIMKHLKSRTASRI
jgi:hypothetical protein